MPFTPAAQREILRLPLRLQTGNALDLDIEAEELRANRSAGGGGVAEVADVDLVHLLEILGGEFREIHAGADDILEISTGRSEDLLHIFENQLGLARDGAADRKSTRLNSSHVSESRMPSSA